KDDTFHVAYAFRTHEAYELELPKYDIQSAKKLHYRQWEITENVGQAQADNNVDLLKERDELLSQNMQLTVKIENLKIKAETNELMILENNETIEILKKKIAMLKQREI
ncbi:MAG: CRISPR-associated protein, partial [Methyloprofundus sp.]|nr:CRISPR-associated protein [Methyloprofundus sp.]